MILFDGTYVNKSGGKVLLEYFISSVRAAGLIDQYIFLIDGRLQSELVNSLKPEAVTVITAGELQRSRFYKSQKTSRLTSIFCFGNVPPPIAIRHIPVFIYFHNVLLFGEATATKGIWESVTLRLKRWYIKAKTTTHYTWITQTSLVKRELSRSFRIEENRIVVMPIYDSERVAYFSARHEDGNSKFFYNADGVDQKNHRVLFESWEILAKRFGTFPELHLNIDSSFPEKLARINQLVSQGIRIINHGQCNVNELQELYNACNYCIFPSLAESFGLPLIEACIAGCKVIASDLPFVYQVIKPTRVFDPMDSKGLAVLVLELLRHPERRITRLVAENNVKELIQKLN